ncbi:MAG: ABC transporter ATP-binding protein [Oligoflexia bacterium]|nr:ABC transporter ATP-binding protein [Oligoflexia bacterium]
MRAAPDRLAIEIRNVTVSYRSYKQRPTSLKESFLKFLRHGFKRSYETFDALSDVTLQVPRGTVFGLIGSNGCGKSTLLKVLAGVLKPSSGMVQVNGTIASLIELGAGFDPELNAIENIFLNGALHKKTKREMMARVPQILKFAELEEFAHTPVKYYSSGMYARLGFAVAVDVDPEILLVDEILAVGDERFQAKCEGVFEELIRKGKTIILVSHSMDLIAGKASQAALIERGRLVYSGDPIRAVEMYRDGSYKSALS